MVLIEYVPFGDLLAYLRKSRGLNDTYYKNPDVKPETNLTSEQLMKFAWEVADGMCYLSSKKVCCTMKPYDYLLIIQTGKNSRKVVPEDLIADKKGAFDMDLTLTNT